MERRKIHEAIDACRPDSSDLTLPEMAELSRLLEDDPTARLGYDRCQSIDRAVINGMHDVPVPSGLADRLMNAISEAGESMPIEPMAAEETSDATVERAAAARTASVKTGRSHRKSPVIALISLAASLAIALVVFIATRESGPQPNQPFAGEVLSWTDAVATNQWSRDFASDAVAAYPFDRSVRFAPERWSQHATRYDGHSVVYDLAQPGRRPAYLFCVRTSTNDAFPKVAPAQPFSTTGGYSIAAWQRVDLLYVLAVEGDVRRYRQFISPPSRLAKNDRQSFLVGTIGKF